MKRLMPLLFSTLLYIPLTHAELVVIVRADAPVQSLTKDEVERIFLKKLKVFPSGGEAVPIGQAAAVETNEHFYAKISRKSKIELKAYWARLMFTGRERPPKDGTNNEGVKRLVAADAKAIGFIDEANMDKRFRVVYRLDE